MLIHYKKIKTVHDLTEAVRSGWSAQFVKLKFVCKKITNHSFLYTNNVRYSSVAHPIGVLYDFWSIFKNAGGISFINCLEIV